MKNKVLKIIGCCNNNCRFCMIPHEYKRTRLMSLSDIKSNIDQIKNKNAIVDFFGGEPTVHPHFLTGLRYARSKNFFVTICSNARLFSYKKFCKQVSDLGIYQIRSSLHGHDKNLHEYLSRTPGSFNQALMGFKNIINFQIPLQVNIVINKYNINYLGEISDLLIKIGVKNIKFSALCLSGNMRF